MATSCDVQFGDRGLQPVRATFMGGDTWVGGGLDYGDYSRMTTVAKKVQGTRRIPREATTWAFNDAKVRAVIVRAVELRACFKRARPGTDAERMARALKHMKLVHIPARKKSLGELCQAYAMMKKAGVGSAKELKTLEMQIAGADTTIRTWREYPATLAALIYRYFRVGEDSTTIAKALGLKPGNVRKVIHVIMRTAVELRFAQPWERTKKWGGGGRWRGIGKAERERLSTSTKPARIRLLVKATTLRAEGWSYEQIARHREFGRWSSGRNILKSLQYAGMHKPAEGVKAKSWKHRGRLAANIDEACRMYESGATCAEVGAKFKVSKNCTWKALKRAGVIFRRGPLAQRKAALFGLASQGGVDNHDRVEEGGVGHVTSGVNRSKILQHSFQYNLPSHD